MVLRFITRELPIVSQKSNIARMRVTEGRLVRTLCLHYSASMIRRFWLPLARKFVVYRLLDSWFTEMSTRAAFLLANRPVTDAELRPIHNPKSRIQNENGRVGYTNTKV